MITVPTAEPTAATTVETPRVWLGCVHHYVTGFLVGKWVDAVDAESATLAELHSESGLGYSGCEEIWGYDTECMPVDREMNAAEAASWGRALESVDEHLRAALAAWVRTGDYSAEGTGDMPVVSDFIERYCGTWASFTDYARDYAESIDLLAGAPEALVRHFDWASWTRDLAFEFTVEPVPGSADVFVFRSL